MNVKLFDLQNELDNTVSLLVEVETERDDALQIAAVREEEISLLNELSEAKDKQVEALQGEIASLQQARDDAVFQQDCLVGDKEELQLQLAECRAQAAAAVEAASPPAPQTSPAGVSTELQLQLAAAQADVRELQRSSQQHLQRALQYADELRAAEARLGSSAQAATEAASLKSRLHHAQVLLDSAEVSKGAAHRRADEADERCAAVMASVQQLAGRVQAAEEAAAQVPALKAALQELQGDLQAAGEYGAVVKVENDALRNMAAALRDKLQRREARITQLKQRTGKQPAAGQPAPPAAVEEF